VLYTAFLLQCFKPPAPPKVQPDKKEKWMNDSVLFTSMCVT
jgi:hypothetical protein